MLVAMIQSAVEELKYTVEANSRVEGLNLEPTDYKSCTLPLGHNASTRVRGILNTTILDCAT